MFSHSEFKGLVQCRFRQVRLFYDAFVWKTMGVSKRIEVMQLNDVRFTIDNCIVYEFSFSLMTIPFSLIIWRMSLINRQRAICASAQWEQNGQHQNQLFTKGVIKWSCSSGVFVFLLDFWRHVLIFNFYLFLEFASHCMISDAVFQILDNSFSFYNPLDSSVFFSKICYLLFLWPFLIFFDDIVCIHVSRLDSVYSSPYGLHSALECRTPCQWLMLGLLTTEGEILPSPCHWLHHVIQMLELKLQV